MLKRISHIILTLTVLLVVLGNTVRIGICPCHGQFFIGDCDCNLAPQSCDCHECTPCVLHDTEELLAEQGQDDGNYFSDDHSSGSCDNFNIETTEPFTLSASIKAPETPSETSFVHFVYDIPANDFLLTDMSLRSFTLLRPPPDLLIDRRLVYLGYMRPALA